MSEAGSVTAPVNPYLHIIQVQGVLLEYAIRHDPLTGALNKNALRSDMRDQMDAGIPIGLGLFDLDNFKVVNDKLGHAEGDKMLISLTDYLQSHLRRPGEEVAFERNFGVAINSQNDEAPISRLGGDEFAVCFQLGDRGQPDGLKPHQRAIKYMLYYRALFDKFVKLQEPEVQKLDLNISVGFAIFEPPKQITVSQLFELADSRMYLAKRDRKAKASKT